MTTNRGHSFSIRISCFFYFALDELLASFTTWNKEKTDVTMKRFLPILLMLYCGCISAQTLQDSVKIQFRTGQSQLDMELDSNRQVLENIKNKLQLNRDDSVYYRLQNVLVVGAYLFCCFSTAFFPYSPEKTSQ